MLVRREWWTELAIVVLLFLVGGVFLACPKPPGRVVNLPAGVSEQQVKDWYVATGAFRTVGSLTEQVTASLVQLNRSGVFPDGPEYVATLTAIGKIAQIGKQAVAYLDTVPQTFGKPVQKQIHMYADQMLAELQTMDGHLLGIKNPGSQAQVKTLLGSIRLAVNVVFSLVDVLEATSSLQYKFFTTGLEVAYAEVG